MSLQIYTNAIRYRKKIKRNDEHLYPLSLMIDNIITIKNTVVNFPRFVKSAQKTMKLRQRKSEAPKSKVNYGVHYQGYTKVIPLSSGQCFPFWLASVIISLSVSTLAITFPEGIFVEINNFPKIYRERHRIKKMFLTLEESWKIQTLISSSRHLLVIKTVGYWQKRR